METELLPVLQSQQSWTSRLGWVIVCCSSFKYFSFITALLAQLVGIILFTIRAADCFFREFSTTSNCEHFSLFPMPKLFEFFWLLSSIFVSLSLVYHVIFVSAEFCGMRKVFVQLIRKKYFYKVTFVLLAVISYDIYVFGNDPKIWTTILYISFIMEKTLTVLLMFLLNFLPRYCNHGESRFQRWLYKAALAMYVLQNFLLALLGSTVAAYKVLNVSDEEGKSNEERPGVKSVVALMLLITNNRFRYFVAEFFCSKIFNENSDILGGSASTIQGSSGAQERKRPHQTLTQSDSS